MAARGAHIARGPPVPPGGALAGVLLAGGRRPVARPLHARCRHPYPEFWVSVSGFGNRVSGFGFGRELPSVSELLGEREPVADRDWWLVVVAQSFDPFMRPAGGFVVTGGRPDVGSEVGVRRWARAACMHTAGFWWQGFVFGVRV